MVVREDGLKVHCQDGLVDRWIMRTEGTHGASHHASSAFDFDCGVMARTAPLAYHVCTSWNPSMITASALVYGPSGQTSHRVEVPASPDRAGGAGTYHRRSVTSTQIGTSGGGLVEQH